MLCTILHKKFQHANPQACIHKTCIRVKTQLGHSLPETRCLVDLKAIGLRKQQSITSVSPFYKTRWLLIQQFFVLECELSRRRVWI